MVAMVVFVFLLLIVLVLTDIGIFGVMGKNDSGAGVRTNYKLGNLNPGPHIIVPKTIHWLNCACLDRLARVKGRDRQ